MSDPVTSVTVDLKSGVHEECGGLGGASQLTASNFHFT